MDDSYRDPQEWVPDGNISPRTRDVRYKNGKRKGVTINRFLVENIVDGVIAGTCLENER
jgi:hypothetical protein